MTSSLQPNHHHSMPGPRDHLFFCTDWHIRRFAKGALQSLLRHSILAYHSVFDANDKAETVARCVVVAPLMETAYCNTLEPARTERPVTFFFQGAIMAWPCSFIR